MDTWIFLHELVHRFTIDALTFSDINALNKSAVANHHIDGLVGYAPYSLGRQSDNAIASHRQDLNRTVCNLRTVGYVEVLQPQL
jgi:hypothetical protein